MRLLGREAGSRRRRHCKAHLPSAVEGRLVFPPGTTTAAVAAAPVPDAGGFVQPEELRKYWALRPIRFSQPVTVPEAQPHILAPEDAVAAGGATHGPCRSSRLGSAATGAQHGYG